MQIHTAEFVISNTDVGKCPRDPIPEYAFIGRSNVGKSSLINMMTNRKGLAKTSGTPGKTQLINHFRIDNRWFLVDLPGYGYARVSKKQRQGFQKLITDYFEKRKQLVAAFVLIDIRLDPQKIDLEFMYWLGTNGIPFTIVFTKADKLKPAAITKKTEEYMQKLTEDAWEEAPPHIVTSAQNGLGKDELLGYIDQINRQLN